MFVYANLPLMSMMRMLQYLEAYNIGMPCQEFNHLIIYHFIELLTPQTHGSHCGVVLAFAMHDGSHSFLVGRHSGFLNAICKTQSNPSSW